MAHEPTPFPTVVSPMRVTSIYGRRHTMVASLAEAVWLDVKTYILERFKGTSWVPRVLPPVSSNYKKKAKSIRRI